MSGNHASTSGFRQPHDLDPKSKTGPAGVIAMRTRDEIGRTVDEGETRYVGVEWIIGHRRQNNQMVPLFQLPHAQAWSTPVIGGDGELQPGCRRHRLPPLHFGSLREAIREPTDDHDPRSILIIAIWSHFNKRRYHMEQLLLSPQEAAQSLGISRSRLYELIRKQELVSILIGRSRRIPVVALREYVQKMTDNAWVA